MTRVRALVLTLALGAACAQSGTIDLALVFPRGQTRLPADAVSLRITLDQPPTIKIVAVAPDGSFDLHLDLPATGASAVLAIDVLDADAHLLARGATPPLPLAVFDGSFKLYVAPPGAFAEAPAVIDVPRAELAVVPISAGALLVGGHDATGTRRTEVAAYDVFVHELIPAVPLAAGRAGMGGAPGSFGLTYFFGGLGDGDLPVGEALVFDAGVAPHGLFATVATDATLARTSAQLAPIGVNLFLVTGNPPIRLDGAGRLDKPAAPPAETLGATTATPLAGGEQIVLDGPTGVALYTVASDSFAPLTGAGGLRTGHGAVEAADGAVVAAGGADATTGALLDTVQRITATGVQVLEPLATARTEPAVARSGDVIVVAGGFDAAGNALGDAEILDSTSLQRIAVVPLVAARGGASAVTLPNGLVLLAGGRTSKTGAPVGTLELYTPAR